VQDLRANSFFIFIFTGETKGHSYAVSFFIFRFFKGTFAAQAVLKPV
jgi:hypothetical protein